MRILLLAQWFEPEPTFKGLTFAKELKKRGHEVSVLTGFPNYPSGRVYPGYRVSLYKRESMDGINVNRVALYPSHDRSTIHSLLNYLSFATSTLFIGPWLVGRPDVIYIYNLVTLAPLAFLLRFLFGTKVVVDVLDLWPDAVVSSKMLDNKSALNLLGRVCKWFYCKADRLITASPGFRRTLIERGVPAEKIEVIYNWCEEANIRKNSSCPVKKEELTRTGKFTALFAGNMGTAQGLDTILDCAKMCSDKLPDARFVLVGGGVDKQRLEERARQMDLNNVTFLPPRPISSMGEIFGIADALIVHLKNDINYRITIPSKTQAYLYMGKPIIMAVSGDAETVVKDARAGVVCRPDDPVDMMSAIQTLAGMTSDERMAMGKRGHEYYMNNQSLEKGVGKFETTFRSCLEQ